MDDNEFALNDSAANRGNGLNPLGIYEMARFSCRVIDAGEKRTALKFL